jgi:hypothetical protein
MVSQVVIEKEYIRANPRMWTSVYNIAPRKAQSLISEFLSVLPSRLKIRRLLYQYQERLVESFLGTNLLVSTKQATLTRLFKEPYIRIMSSAWRRVFLWGDQPSTETAKLPWSLLP